MFVASARPPPGEARYCIDAVRKVLGTCRVNVAEGRGVWSLESQRFRLTMAMRARLSDLGVSAFSRASAGVWMENGGEASLVGGVGGDVGHARLEQRDARGAVGAADELRDHGLRVEGREDLRGDAARVHGEPQVVARVQDLLHVHAGDALERCGASQT